MTKIVEDVKVLTYDEWSKRPEVIGMLKDIQDCDTCDGEGEHECDCGHVHECGSCGGSGKATNFRDVYEKLLCEELNRRSCWITGVPIRYPQVDRRHSIDNSIIALNIIHTDDLKGAQS